MIYTRPFLLGPGFVRTALPCSGGYRLERGGMPSHDGVGVNCKKGMWGSMWGKKCIFDDCVCAI